MWSENPTGRSSGVLLVVSAPSGAGKTSITREILRMFPHIRFSVSYTTRAPRPGEVNGKDYHFISEASFRQRIAKGEFVEWVENYGQLYGTSKKAMDSFLARGEDLILDIEPRGANAIRDHYPRAVFVFIMPPSLSELKNRLVKRGESAAVMERRLNNSLDEMREARWYDYLIFNEHLDGAVERFRAIYLAEKSRRERCQEKLEAFFSTGS